MREINKNIAWVEPNFIYSSSKDLVVNNIDTNQERVYETTPPLEDFCIAVDLEVEIMERGKGGVTTPAKTILVSWTSKSKEKGKVSFFEGTKHKYGDKVGVNYLTSTPVTFGTFEEVKNEGTNECFGINSIDIQYNSYMVPEVTIEFTDIRGISLFSPEELRHSGVNEEGIGGMVDYEANIAGSFFKCFFSFPYPRFKLMVKGFYGEPTSYELTVADFRTRFDCNTGNFNATAKFVGYAYSLLNDVTMNALVVAPLNEYFGENYWKTNVENGRFSFEDNTPMQRINEIIEKTSKLKENIEKLNNESPISQKTRELDIENKKITNIVNAHDNFFISLAEYFKTFKFEGTNNPLTNRNNKTLVVFFKEENFKDIKVTDEITSRYNILKETLINYGNGFEKLMPYGDKVEFQKNEYTVLVDEIKTNFPEYASQCGINFTEGKWYVIYYNGSGLNEKINTIKDKNDNEITENQKELNSVTKQMIINALSFNPTVENVTKLIFAHFETLMASMYNCINSIDNKRQPSTLGLTTTDIYVEGGVGPFPRVDIKSIHNGIESNEEGWLGDLLGGKNEQEVQLIEGLLKAVDKFSSLTEQPSQLLFNGSSDISARTVMEIPVTPMDILMTKHPYGNEIDFNNISDVIGKVALRMTSIIGIYDNIFGNDYYDFGKADAYNFKAKYPSVGKTFLTRLCGGNESINTNLFLNCLRNLNTEEKIDNKWAWDSGNDKSKGMFDSNSLILYDVDVKDNKKCKILPISNFNWGKINSTVLMDQYPEDIDDFVSTCYIDDKDNKYFCNNIFKLDENYKSYSGYTSKMAVDNKQFNYVNKLKLNFDLPTYLNEFYKDDERVFGKKLSDIDPTINFNSYHKSHIIPSKRQLSKIEAKNSTSFNGSSPFDNDFNFLKTDKKNINRKSKGSFSNINDITNLLSYTIPTFRGVKTDKWLFNTVETDDKIFTNEWSLFGQLDYYKIPTEEGKALAFLDTLKLKEEGSNMGGFRFDNYSLDNDKNLTAHILNDKEPFMIMPYSALLLLGGYFWREREINNGKGEPLGEFIHKNKRNKPFEAITYSIDSKLFSLRYEIKNTLIDEFVKWVGDSISGFQVFKSFELSPKNGNQIEFVEKFINELKTNKENIESFLWDNANDNFYKNYISFNLVNDNIKLFNRETSTDLNTFITFYLKPCMVIKPTKYIFDSFDVDIKFNGRERTYLNGFLTKLKELYQKDYETSKAEPIIVNPIRTSEHIKINLYKYLKILYDKWLSGCKIDDWKLENFYYNNWYFLDSFYNKIGDRILINMPKFSEDILYSQKESGYSLLSFISKAYASNRLAFHCVQNFMDLKNEHEEEKFKKLFKAIPYNEIDFNNINFHPAFLLMYVYEQSSKLDIKDKNAQYKNDSFNLDDPDDLPTQITSKVIDEKDGSIVNGFKIPAFAVTYGKQYQSYFKNIDISTDNPIVTEEAIKTQFMIASMNSNHGENGKKIEFLGQDLYTIYSNNSYTCTVKMMGCAWIQPLMYFQLNNIPMFRGAYLIQKVSHHIEPGNMETTFVGVRMAKQTNKLVDEALFSSENDQVAPQAREIYENALAEVTNDYKYAFYNPNNDFEYPAMPEEDLGLSLRDYETKYNVKFNSVVKNKDKSVQQFLADIVNGEAANQDGLGKQLVAVVLFNRYMHFGKNLAKMFWDSQHELGGEGEDDDVKIVSEIFTKSPSILKGQKSFVKKQIPILNDGQPTSNNTQPIELDMHMLKSMDGYCTTRGYDIGGGHTCPKEPLGWWHKAEYLVQHDGNGNWGHVFVSGAFNGSKEHWQEKEKRIASGETTNPSEKAIGLFDAIKRTIETSQSIKCDNISMEKDNNDYDMFYIVAKPEKAMIDIFDATVNTYYDYFSQCNWIVNNDGKENPIKIRIKAEENANERNITISRLKNNGSLDNLNTHEELNPFFYITLKKKYGVIDTNNKELFKNECKNFNKLASSDSDWITIVNNLLDNKIEPYGGEVNLPIIDGYSWDGSPHVQNQNKPTKTFNDDFDPYSAATHARTNALESSIGKCASYVRQAFKAAGAGDMSDIPMSACVYSKFMEAWGFKRVYEGFSPNSEGYSPNEGDVSVIAGTKVKPHGHIQIYSHGKWYSDYGDNDVYCYNADIGRPYIVFRWDGGTT